MLASLVPLLPKVYGNLKMLLQILRKALLKIKPGHSSKPLGFFLIFTLSLNLNSYTRNIILWWSRNTRINNFLSL